MPSPVGHALGGLIVAELLGFGRLATKPPEPLGRQTTKTPLTIGRQTTKTTLIIGRQTTNGDWVRGMCVVAAVLPDIDFAWGRHSYETHSLGAAVIAGLVVYAWKKDARLAIAASLAWSTHVLFDWLGSDDTPPLGVMAFWPLTSKFYFANAFVFEAISRRYWLDNFITHNAWAVIKEVLLLGPITALAWALRNRRLKIP